MDTPKWHGCRLVPTYTALRELQELDMDLFDAVNVLEYGFDCPKSRRSPGVHERCIREGNKVIRIVVVPWEVSYHDGSIEKVWKVIHAGKGGRLK